MLTRIVALALLFSALAFGQTKEPSQTWTKADVEKYLFEVSGPYGSAEAHFLVSPETMALFSKALEDPPQSFFKTYVGASDARGREMIAKIVELSTISYACSDQANVPPEWKLWQSAVPRLNIALRGCSYAGSGAAMYNIAYAYREMALRSKESTETAAAFAGLSASLMKAGNLARIIRETGAVEVLDQKAAQLSRPAATNTEKDLASQLKDTAALLRETKPEMLRLAAQLVAASYLYSAFQCEEGLRRAAGGSDGELAKVAQIAKVVRGKIADFAKTAPPKTPPAPQKQSVDWPALAKQGARLAQYMVGLDFLHQEDYASAMKWLLLSVQDDKRPNDVPLHPTNLATVYFYIGGLHSRGGHGITQNYPAAREWFQKASDLTHLTEAEFELGQIYDFGLGVAKDKEKAFAYYRSAAGKGHGLANCVLGDLTVWGKEGVARNPQAGADMLFRGAEKGYALCQRQLGDVYLADKRPEEARKLYVRSAVQGSPKGQIRAAVIYSEPSMGLPADLVQAHMWLSVTINNPKSTAGDRSGAEKLLGMIVPQMSAAQIAQAKKLAAEFKPKLERPFPQTLDETFEYKERMAQLKQ